MPEGSGTPTPLPGAAIRARSIPLYAALLVGTIGAGLASRAYPGFFPAFFAMYAGDTLWAMMVFWLLALLWRAAPTARLAAGAITIAVAVECSQLYHAPWLDAIRDTRIGALALGSGFLWSDLVCYAVGVAIAATLDRALRD
ncbi:MAG: DUF2809 domain-containing protein [Gemmatimonadota bacterium]